MLEMRTCPTLHGMNLRKRTREVAPKVTLTIRNADGEVVDKIAGSTSKGIHQNTWQMSWSNEGVGVAPIALPGTIHSRNFKNRGWQD